jgi:hypothetical protein
MLALSKGFGQWIATVGPEWPLQAARQQMAHSGQTNDGKKHSANKQARKVRQTERIRSSPST